MVEEGQNLLLSGSETDGFKNPKELTIPIEWTIGELQEFLETIEKRLCFKIETHG